MPSNIRRVALSVIREMLPTDTEDGTDVDSLVFENLIRDHSEGEHFSQRDLRGEVIRMLKVIGTGRLNVDL